MSPANTASLNNDSKKVSTASMPESSQLVKSWDSEYKKLREKYFSPSLTAGSQQKVGIF